MILGSILIDWQNIPFRIHH